MKQILAILALIVATFTTARADDKPITFEQLPQEARTFVTTNYPQEKVVMASVDDDFFSPDYKVTLANGVRIEFLHSGKLEKIETRDGNIPAGIIPAQIQKAIKDYYPEAIILEYEVGRRSYEVKLSNRLEIKFNSSFQIVEVDD